MTQYLPEFLTVVVLHLLAVMAPGPDFIMITRSSFLYSRKAGIYSAMGLGLGILVHVTYSLVGIGLIISKSVILFSIIKLLGAGYLIYIGYKSLTAKKQAVAVQIANSAEQKYLTKREAIKIGFLTNILNPKVTLFFLALFTQVINQTTPLYIKVLYGAEMSLVTFLWFALVAVILSHGTVKKPFAHIQHYVEKTMGALLIALGIKVALSSSK